MKKQSIHVLLVAALVAVMAYSAAPVYAVCTINGTVFRDFNANGARAVPVESGYQSIIVQAYDATGAIVATATSDAFGNYSLVNIPDSIPVRIEMSIPATHTFLRNGAVGSGADSSVQFITCGVGTTVNNQNFSINNPAQYCQPNPDLVTSCYIFGDQIAGPNSTRSDVITYPYLSGATGTTPNSAPQPGGANIHTPAGYVTRALANQVGSVWGTSYQPESDTIFVASIIKRHVGLGPTDNPGTIYRVDLRTGTVAPFVTLAAGANPHTLANPLNPAFPPYFDDIGAFNAVGYVGLGDIDISDDASTMYAVNLADNNMYIMSIGNPAGAAPLSTSAVALPVGLPGAAVGCPGPVRPGALKGFDGVIYAGLTCTGPTAANLRAYVYAYRGGFGAAPVAEFALNYPRGCASRNGTCDPAPADNPAEWIPWITDTNNDPSDDGISGIFSQTYAPQPWLLDIEFDEYGYMIANLADRAGFQLGNRVPPASTGPAEGVVAGDLLRLAPTGTTWTLESNASSGNPATQQGAATTAGAGNGEGPGNGEFYFQEDLLLVGFGGHDEIVTGGITQVYGTGEIVASAFDPARVGDIRTSGVVYLSHATGERTRSVEIVPMDAPGTFGKAAGLGDVEALCGPAPLEIGNRIWLDANNNGVQDADETPIGGVTARLYIDDNGDGIPDGPAVGVAVTDAQGRYIFRGARSFPGVPDGAAAGDGLNDGNLTDSEGIVGQYFDINAATLANRRFATNNATRSANEPRGIMPFTGYLILLDNPADYAPGGPLFEMYASTPGTGGADVNGIVRDSNGVVLNPQAFANGTLNLPAIRLRTGNFGANDHTFDFGFTPVAPVIVVAPTAAPGDGGSGGGSGSGNNSGTPAATMTATGTATAIATVDALSGVRMLPATGETPLTILRLVTLTSGRLLFLLVFHQ